MLRVMPETGGRGAGGFVEYAVIVDAIRHCVQSKSFWRAGCAERCKSGSEGSS